MKNTLYTIALSLSIFVIGCKEEPPSIDFKKPVVLGDLDTTYISSTVDPKQDKVVLIEDFTGVRCPNCPKAHEVVSDLIKNNPNRVVAISLHPTKSTLTAPISEDFRLQEATDIKDNLGGYFALPAGGIDRIHFNGENYTLVSNSDNWSGYFNTRKALNTPYNVTIDNVYDAATKEVLSTVKVMLTAATTDSLSLTMLLTENKIVSDQEIPDQSSGSNIIIPDYEHNHLVRTFYTPALGKQLLGSKVPGRVFVYRVKRKLDDKWKPENCTIVAYVHSVGAKKEVFQSAEKAVR